MLQRLKELGVKRVAFDVLFTGPGADPQADTQLIRSFSEIPSVIGAELSIRSIQKQGGGFTIENLEQPYEPFRKVATQALVGVRDRKLMIRHFPIPRSDRERSLPFLAQAAADIKSSDDPSLPGPYDLIRYYGPGRTVPFYSYWELLSDDAPLAADDAALLAAVLRAPPSRCNAEAVAAPWSAALPGLWRDELITGASHCDFESPTDWMCRLACGEADPARQQRVRQGLLDAAARWLR
jgi:hypothetical protein